MKLKLVLIIFFLSPFFGTGLAAQDEEELSGSETGFYFGVNAGGYLANKHTAGYYGGYGDFAIQDLIAIPQIYSQIYNQLQKDFYMGEYPSNVRYRTGLDVGLHLGYYLDESTAVFSNVDLVRLRVQEVFTLEAENPANPSGDPLIFPQVVSGEENRMIIDLGLHIDYGDRNKASGYLEFFGSFNSVKAKKNEVIIEDALRYSLLMQPNVYNRTELGRVGWGFGVGTGCRLKFNTSFSFDIGVNASFQRIGLFVDERLKLNPLIYVRILWL